jgi:hypothetical protein
MKSGNGNVALLASAIAFAVFFANVALGAAGEPPFLPDIAEMLTLFVACILFVIAILARERAAPPADNDTEGRIP